MCDHLWITLHLDSRLNAEIALQPVASDNVEMAFIMDYLLPIDTHRSHLPHKYLIGPLTLSYHLSTFIMTDPAVHREIAKVPRQPLDLDFPLSHPDSTSSTNTSSSDLAFFLSSTGQSTAKDLEAHASGIQKEAYEIYSYPCIRRWAFMT